MLELIKLLTWWYTGGDSGGRELTLAFGGHSCHLDGVSGERSEPCHLVLLSQVGQIMSHPSIGPVELLPRDTIAWKCYIVLTVNKAW